MRSHILVLSVVLFACGGGSVSIPDASDDASLDAAVQEGGAGDGAGGDATVDGDATDAADTGTCASKCSPSTHEVLDCNRQVLKACAPTEACDIGTLACVNACAAQANNKQSIGCDYYPVNLEILQQVAYHCYALVIANTWSAPAKFDISYNGQPLTVASFTRTPQGTGTNLTYQAYNPANGIAVGDVAIAFLGGESGNAGCPVAPAFAGTSSQVTGTTIGKAFHLTTDVPVAVYQISPYGVGALATGSSLLLPRTAWGSNYIANTASPQTISPPSFDVVASENGTQVKLFSKVAIAGGGGINPSSANQQLIINLNAGEVAQLSQTADLVGTIVETSKPVGLFSASPCMNVPLNTVYCDHGEQMMLPIQSLASEYPAVGYRPRLTEPWMWRVVGVVDGTNLSYAPAVNGAPATLNKGQMAEFEATAEFVVTSQDAQHPFELFAYMTGGSWAKLSTPGYGDPDHVVITPPGQYLRDYVFFTDPTFPETNLVVVRAKNGNAFEDVKLDCLGTLTGWQPLGASYEYTRTDLQTGDFQPVGNCSNGRHEMQSKGPFGLWVWGWGTPKTAKYTSHVSYGYPGGTNVRVTNNVVVPAQ